MEIRSHVKSDKATFMIYFTTTLNHKRVNYVKFIIRVSTAVYDVECSPPSIDQMSGGAGLASDVYVVVNGVLIAI